MTEPEAPVLPPAASPIERAVQQGLQTERRNADIDLRTRELRYREAVDTRLLRLLIGGSVFLVSVLWLIADVVLVVALGLGELSGRPFKLDSAVIVAFLTTSTATVIGLFLVFLRWLYPQGGGGRENEDRRRRGREEG